MGVQRGFGEPCAAILGASDDVFGRRAAALNVQWLRKRSRNPPCSHGGACNGGVFERS